MREPRILAKRDRLRRVLGQLQDWALHEVADDGLGLERVELLQVARAEPDLRLAAGRLPVVRHGEEVDRRIRAGNEGRHGVSGCGPMNWGVVWHEVKPS